MWLRKGNLGCDTCDKVFDSRGAAGTTLMFARAAGWHVYEGLAADDTTPLSSHLCPDCVGTPRSPLKKTPPLDGDKMLPLFSDAA